MKEGLYAKNILDSYQVEKVTQFILDKCDRFDDLIDLHYKRLKAPKPQLLTLNPAEKA